LYGLQNLDAGVVPRELLLALSRKIDESGAILDSQEIGNALYGLQNLDAGVVPRELLLALSRKIDESGAILDSQEIGNALYGLQDLRGTAEARYMIDQLFDLIKNEINLDNDIDLITLVRSVSLYDRPLPKWLEDRYNNFIRSQESKSTNGELKSQNVLTKRLRETVLVNHYIDGFELDLYIPTLKANIELDGRYHYSQRGRDAIRDRYLKGKGIKVYRIDLMKEGLDAGLERVIGLLGKRA
ncbi:MAG: DUF559 domain-containing protein, partial [Pseudomonadota bacterium]